MSQAVLSQVILALSLGKPVKAGGNVLTGDWVEEISQGIIPVVADASVMLYNYHYGIGSPNPATHVSTYVLVEEFVRICFKEKWRQVIVVCAPDYSDRVVRDLKKAFKEIQYHPVILKAELSGRNDSAAWYHGSRQWWTKSRWRFLFYEFIVRHLPWWLYKKMSRAE